MLGGRSVGNFIYRCPQCSFVYFVPAYWMSFMPNAETELPHQNMETGEDCPNMKLAWVEDAE